MGGSWGVLMPVRFLSEKVSLFCKREDSFINVTPNVSCTGILLLHLRKLFLTVSFSDLNIFEETTSPLLRN